ncbi:hypothetical protein B0T26DRAFT_490284 [Lasiosphaeria miniovina]|uniref:Uncharacterized protein n=1 Tax=Lasiosphaeria miniovina TaxID=1954250 RepID=A0AA40DJJ7_9PEZI|nr:uncharacterized protein B0T26DRAFT_490284 [Lasiosphaeria miniovina]KAK0703087.1 hypothetical protein B0T26DRAFT_490284 [Lasiosphaeria miniovina]
MCHCRKRMLQQFVLGQTFDCHLFRVKVVLRQRLGDSVSATCMSALQRIIPKVKTCRAASRRIGRYCKVAYCLHKSPPKSIPNGMAGRAASSDDAAWRVACQSQQKCRQSWGFGHDRQSRAPRSRIHDGFNHHLSTPSPHRPTAQSPARHAIPVQRPLSSCECRQPAAAAAPGEHKSHPISHLPTLGLSWHRPFPAEH